MMLYRNAKVKVYSQDGDTDYFDNVTGVLQGVKLALCLFIICLDYVVRTSIDIMKENCVKLSKKKIEADDIPLKQLRRRTTWEHIPLLANTLAQTVALLHSMDWEAAGIGLYVKAGKTEYMCFNQRGNISTTNGSSLKLVDKFTYQGSNVTSSAKDINTQLAKA